MSELSESQRDAFVTGGILFVLGVYVIYSSGDWQGGFVLVGFGIVIMASANQEWAQDVWESFFGFFRRLFKKITSE